MAITQKQIDQTYADYGGKFGGSKNDYFPPLFLEQDFGWQPEDLAMPFAFGDKDYKADVYHLDKAERNFHICQFKSSKYPKLFVDSLKRLIAERMSSETGAPVKLSSVLACRAFRGER